MQKLADGHDTAVGSSLAWLWSRCVAAPQAGAALVPGPDDAGEPLHPVAAPMSRRAAQVLIRRVATFTGPRRECG